MLVVDDLDCWLIEPISGKIHDKFSLIWLRLTQYPTTMSYSFLSDNVNCNPIGSKVGVLNHD